MMLTARQGQARLRGEATRFAGLTLAVDALMALFKIVVGLFSGSHAVLASALYSINDVLSAIAVAVSLRFGYRKPNDANPYGYGKAEFIAVGIVSLAIAIGVCAMLLYSILDVMKGVSGPPHAVALIVAVISAVVNWRLARRGRALADALQSPALTTSAEHHSADAIGSAATVAGAGAALLGFHAADRYVAIIETLHLVALSGILLAQSTKGLMDAALPEEDTELIESACRAVSGVEDVVGIRSRSVGRDTWVDVAVAVEPELPVARAHELRRQVQRAIVDVIGRGVVAQVRFQSPHTEIVQPGPAGSHHG
jgi:cation diffusion facilitator family transporter